MERPGANVSRRQDGSIERPPADGPRDRASLATTLSSVIAQLDGVRARLPDGDHRQARLGAVTAQLEAIGHDLLFERSEAADEAPRHWSSAVASPGSLPGSEDAGAPNDDERRFLRWLKGRMEAGGSGGSGDVDPGDIEVTRAVLGELSTSMHGLPADAIDVLGLPEAATIGDAAVVLLLAVHDPSGPRCDSYEAALTYLSSRHDLLRTP